MYLIIPHRRYLSNYLRAIIIIIIITITNDHAFGNLLFLSELWDKRLYFYTHIVLYIYICRYCIWYLWDRQSFTVYTVVQYQCSFVNKINNLSQYFKRSASVCTCTFVDSSKRDEKLKGIKTHWFISVNESKLKSIENRDLTN